MNNGLTALEIADSTGKAVSTITRRAKREKWPFFEQLCRGGNGGKVRVYRVEMLPADVRHALGGCNTVQPYVTPGNNGGGPNVWCPELADWQNEKALAWADAVREYEKAKHLAKCRKQSVTAAAKEFVTGYNSGLVYPRLFGITGSTSYQSLESKLKTFKDSGRDYTVLAPAWGNRKGVSKMSDEEFHLVLSFALHPHRFPLDTAIRLAIKTMKRRGIRPGCHKDTYKRTVARWKEENYDRWVLMREGEKALNDKVLPYIERDASLVDVGDILVADGHQLNFLIKDPFTGKDARMALVLWFDTASCYPAGWEIMATENSQCIAAGLRRAILALGMIPKVAYLDNSKAFKAKVFTDPHMDFEEAGFYGMFARLGIMTIFAWPYNAQSKRVERFFGDFAEFERMMPTYTGTSIEAKPARLKRNEKLHIKLHKKLFGDYVPTIYEAHDMIRAWVAEYANDPKKHLGGRTPWEVFSDGRGPGVDQAALRHMMLSRTVKGINRNGITLSGMHYYAPELYGRKHRATVLYDFGRPESVLVYSEDGKEFICEAELVKSLHPAARILGAPEDEREVQAAIRMKRALKRRTEEELRSFVDDGMGEACTTMLPARPALPPASRKKASEGPGPTITPGEIERMRREEVKLDALQQAAEKQKVIRLKQQETPETFLNDVERYEIYLKMEVEEDDLSIDQLRWMRWYESTKDFKKFEPRFEMLREMLLLKKEDDHDEGKE